MQLIKKIIIKIYKLGFLKAFKFFFQRINDNFCLNYLTNNLVKKSFDINSPLILITQIQRSGGTLLSQLFDGHDEIYAYPNELTIWEPKWELKNLDNNFDSFNNDYIKFFALNAEYKKESKSKWNKSYKFFFNLNSQEKIFFNLTEKKSNQREILNAYFSSFFSSWLNYKNNIGKKSFVTAFIPRVNFNRESINYFFSNYNDGKIITITRDPLNWLASAIKHDPKNYGNVAEALSLWKKSTHASLKLIKEDKAIGVNFDNLIKNTKKTMDFLCDRLKIQKKEILYIPTFNNEPILSDSSFKSIEGKIDQDTLKRTINLEQDEIKKQLSESNDLVYECNKLYSDYCNITKLN